MNARAIPFLPILGLLCACPNDLQPIDEGGTDSGGGDAIPPAVQDVFDRRCGFAGCHGMGSAQAGLALDPAQSGGIVDGPSSAGIPMVTIGDVCRSYLAIKILPKENNRCDVQASGSLMPIGGRDRADVQLDLAVVLGWIAGADLTAVGGGGGTSGGASTGTGGPTGTGSSGATAGSDTGTAGTGG